VNFRFGSGAQEQGGYLAPKTYDVKQIRVENTFLGPQKRVSGRPRPEPGGGWQRHVQARREQGPLGEGIDRRGLQAGYVMCEDNAIA
jgi:hypothetical protein